MAERTCSDFRAITEHQPHASLVALGHKQIITRAKPTDHRGPLLIHAGAAIPKEGMDVGGFTVERWRDEPDKPCLIRDTHFHPVCDLPLGAVVGVATLVDCVPIIDAGKGVAVGVRSYVADLPHGGDLPHQQGGLWLIGVNELTHGHPTLIEAERRFSDFTPGRFAYLLAYTDPVEPVSRFRCPSCEGNVSSCPPLTRQVCRKGGWVDVRGRQGVWRPDPMLVEEVLCRG